MSVTFRLMSFKNLTINYLNDVTINENGYCSLFTEFVVSVDARD